MGSASAVNYRQLKQAACSSRLLATIGGLTTALPALAGAGTIVARTRNRLTARVPWLF